MEVRTFEATRMKDAIAAVKRELGADAVIISTRESPSKGPKGTNLYEVTAASAVSQRTGASRKNPEASSDLIQARLDLIENQLVTLNANITPKKYFDILESSVHELKIMISESFRSTASSFVTSQPKEIQEILKTLSGVGIHESTQAELAKYLKKAISQDAVIQDKQIDLSDAYKSEAMKWMLKRIRIAPKWNFTQNNPLIQIFTGPSGSGKSSTIAKLAAHYALKEKKSALIVSYEQEKIGAQESLRMYAKIIGIPFVSIHEPTELRKLIAKDKSLELIFVDVGSRNTKTGKKLDDLELFKNVNDACEFHLVLSTTEKPMYLDQSVRFFSEIGIQSLIFTKTDESSNFADIFNLSNRWSLPLSFFSTGTDIPNDIERATRERVVEKVFGI